MSGAPSVLAWDRIQTALGEFWIAARRTDFAPRLARLDLGGREGQAGLERLAAERFDDARLERDEDYLAPIRQQLEQYAEGERRSFELELDPGGTEFQRAVWDALCTIPFGATWTYAQLARAVDRPGGQRAVGRANGANPLPLVVPCHRVLSSAGLGGFSGLPEYKLRLLSHEGVLLPGLAHWEGGAT